MIGEYMKKQDKKYIGIMVLLIVILGVIFFLSPYVFGSKTDWLGQHIAFPDYFRNLFYETGNFFPSFSMHLGSGQNIFNFSYYGLYNPIIVFSYLFPFISMKDYIVFTSLLGILVSMILLYYFLKNKFQSSTAFLCCLLYFLASPIIFHAHRHIMFVNYMPFLIWGLIAVDRYLEKKKIVGLTISVFLMILTSYYYSIGGILVLVIYGIYIWLKDNKFQFGIFIKEGIQFLLPIITGILLAAFFLLPTAYCLLGGREGASHNISLVSLFLPTGNLDSLLYSSYCLGITSIFIFALWYFITYPKKQHKWLGISILFICFLPLVVYLLNGTLYIRTKSLIPFLPLALYMVAFFLEDMLEHKKISLFFVVAFCFFHLFLLLRGFTSIRYYLDLFVMIFAFLLYHRYGKKWLVIVPLLTCAFIVCLCANLKEDYVKKSYSDFSTKTLIQNIQMQDNLWRTSAQVNTLYGINQIYSNHHYSTSLYSSVYHADYSTFFKTTFEKALPYRNQLILGTASNLPFQVLMGERYVISTCQKNFIGYQKITSEGDICLYENQDVYPLGYGSSQILSETEFQELSYPYSIEALLHTIIVKDYPSTVMETPRIQEVPFEYQSRQIGEQIQIQKSSNGYTVTVNEKDKMIYTFKEPIHNQLLFIDFYVEEEPSCKDGDLSITINDITNKLTCSSWEYKNENHRFAYVLSESDLEQLEVTFAKGNYKLNDFHIYVWNYADVSQKKEELSPFLLDKDKTTKDKIQGTIAMKKDGYFVLSIPYDKGFHISVDGKKIAYEKVNTAFLGFPLKSGHHLIEITYEAPYFQLGKTISVVTLGFFFLYLVMLKRYQK